MHVCVLFNIHELVMIVVVVLERENASENEPPETEKRNEHEETGIAKPSESENETGILIYGDQLQRESAKENESDHGGCEHGHGYQVHVWPIQRE